jgi:hypothetical protein
LSRGLVLLLFLILLMGAVIQAQLKRAHDQIPPVPTESECADAECDGSPEIPNDWKRYEFPSDNESVFLIASHNWVVEKIRNAKPRLGLLL